MATGSGLAAQIMYGEESTYGTRVVPTRALEFNDESLDLQLEHIESAGLRAGNRVLRTDRQVLNKKGAAGQVSHEVHNKGFSMLFKHAFGKAPTITTPGGGTLTRQHAHTLGDGAGLMLTTQVGRPDTGGTVRPFDYVGCKVAEWELLQELDALLMLRLSLDANDEKTDQSLAVASYPSSSEEFHYGQCSVTVAGSAFDPTTLGLTANNGLKTDRHFIRSDTKKKQPIAAELAGISGRLAGEFESLTAYNRFVNGTIVAVVATWTGSLIEGALNYKIVLTLPAVRFDGETPKVGGPGVLEQPLPFKVLNNGTDEPVTLDYYTTDTAV